MYKDFVDDSAVEDSESAEDDLAHGEDEPTPNEEDITAPVERGLAPGKDVTGSCDAVPVAEQRILDFRAPDEDALSPSPK